MVPGTLIGKYQITRALGRGAMGEVWAAVNADTDREVALKLITSPDPELRRRLLREARAIGRLNHPNIVQILDRGETEHGMPFLVMQLLHGETLADRLVRDGVLPEPVAVGIALDVARALRVAHEKEIIHRDLKPANIFLHREPDTDEDVVKVLDFGVSKLSIENEGAATAMGGILGSPAYMSPEQIRSEGVDGRADVWAVGVVLFEMLAGRRPFTGMNHIAILGQILTQSAPRVDRVARNVTPALADLVASCMERDLAKRISSAAELGRLLRAFSTRGRHLTLEAPRDRVASIPDAPLPSAIPDDEEPEEERITTTVYQPSMGMLPRKAASGSAGTGTVLITKPTKPAVPSRESATALWQSTPANTDGDTPSVDESERPTSPVAVGRPAQPVAPPMFDSGSWNRPPPSSGSGPRPEEMEMQSGAAQASPKSESLRARIKTQRIVPIDLPPPPPPDEFLGGTIKVEPGMPIPSPAAPLPAPPPPKHDIRGGTLKVEPGMPLPGPAANQHVWKPRVAPASMQPVSPTLQTGPKRLPLVLLGLSLVVLGVVLSLLYGAIVDQPTPPQPAPSTSAAAPSTPVTAASSPPTSDPPAQPATVVPTAAQPATSAAVAAPAEPPSAAPKAPPMPTTPLRPAPVPDYKPPPNPPF